jgi:RNA polymerase sigma-70 factor (ECF subfamily)
MHDHKTLSDPELITLLKASDHAAYTEIYNRYYYLLFVFSYKKTRDEELAKDIVQDIFVKLWSRRGFSVIPANLPGYLISSAKNSIFNLFEHQNVRSKYIESLMDYLNSGNHAHTDYLVRENEWKKYIDNAIQALPPKMRQIFQLNKKDNLSYREIASKLDTSENNVQKHINGAIKILRTKLTAFF